MTDETWIASVGTVQLGDRKVHRLGLGTNRVTDTEPARALLRHAVEVGVDFIDTADVYQSNASEITIGKTLGAEASHIVIATKGGMFRPPDDRGAGGRPQYRVDSHPDYLQRAVEGSLRRLQVSYIELYQLHRVDPDVPIEASVGALKEIQKAGQIRQIGLSNVTVEQLERARRVATIVSVQNKYNLFDRESEPVLNYCEAHSIVFIPWTPVNRGNLTSSVLREVAARYHATPHQMALRWLLQRSPLMLAIPGTLSPVHLEQNLAAANIELTEDDFQRLSEIPHESAPT